MVIVDVLARFDDAINNCNISTLAELATPTAAIKIIFISVKFVYETRFFATWNNAYTAHLLHSTCGCNGAYILLSRFRLKSAWALH